MMGLDTWQEIFSTISKNKLRAFLTGFSVAWGIFMLIILLGAGNGLKNGIFRNFEESLLISMFVYGGRTTKPFKGMKEGRYIQLSNDDYKEIKRNIPEVELITSLFNPPGQNYVAHNNRSVSFRIITIFPDYQAIDKLKILEGRFINNIDIRQKRKVAAISPQVKKELFKHKNAIGEYINVNGFLIRVVGVFEDDDNDDSDECIYLPITTAQLLYGRKKDISMLQLTIPSSSTKQESLDVEQRIRKQIAALHKFDPEDERAAYKIYWQKC